MSSWQLIQDVHCAITKNSPPPHLWRECVRRLLEVLGGFKSGEEAERTKDEPSLRDQMLVLLTVFINLTEPMKYRNNVQIPLQELSTALVKLITSQEDPFITNLAIKCLSQCLASKPPQDCDAEWYAPVLQPCLRCLQVGNRLEPVIDLFRLLFSKRTMMAVGAGLYDIEKLRIWCMQEITWLWRPLVDDVLTRGLPESLTSDSRVVDPVLISLLSLWVKLIKTHYMHLASDLLVLDAQCLAPLQTTTARLVGIAARQRLPPVVFDKICNVLNSTLLYGSSIDQFQYGTGEGHGFAVDLAADVLRSVQMGLLDLVPVDAGERGFAGCLSPTADADARKEPLESERQLDTTNFQSVRKVTLLVLKACAVITRSATYAGISLGAVELVLETLWEWAVRTVPPADQHHWVIAVFGDQDDYLVEAMLCLLDIYTTIGWQFDGSAGGASQGASGTSSGSTSSTGGPLVGQHGSDPHEIFLHFLGHASMDHTVLLDLLTSPETCFLLYLVRYLRHAAHSWERLSDICLTWTPLLEDLEKRTPRPTDSDSPPDDKSCTPRASESSSSLVDNLPVVEGKEEEAAQCEIQNEAPRCKLTALRVEGTDLGGRVNTLRDGAAEQPPDVVLTPPEEEARKGLGLGRKSPANAGMPGALKPLAPKLVDYSDDSLSESEGEGGGREDAEAGGRGGGGFSTFNTLGSNNQLSVETDSACSDQGRSLTASLTSLTSVTSDLDMPSDLQDMSMDTDVEDGALDQLMAVLIRLRLIVERLDDKGLFPYNASALRRLLRQTEALYDGEED